MRTPQNYSCQCTCPHNVPQLLSASAEDLPVLADKSGPVSYRLLLFPWVTVSHETLSAPSTHRVSVSPVLWNFFDQTLLAFEARFSGAPPPTARPQGKEPDIELRSFTYVGELLW